MHHRWRKIAARTLSKAWDDSLFGMSSQAAFWCALSTAPLLLALLGLIGYVVQWFFPPGTIDDVREQVLLFLNTIFDEEVADNLVGNTVDTILASGPGRQGLRRPAHQPVGRVVGHVGVRRVDHHRLQPARGPAARSLERFFALGLYLLALVAGIVMLPLLAIGPDYLPRLFPDDWRGHGRVDRERRLLPRARARADLPARPCSTRSRPSTSTPGTAGLPGAFLAAAVFIVDELRTAAVPGLRVLATA